VVLFNCSSNLSELSIRFSQGCSQFSSVFCSPIRSVPLMLQRFNASTLQRFNASLRQSDVPYGVLLSGGLDSSLVASIMSRNSQRRQHTGPAAWPQLHSFSIGLKGSRGTQGTPRNPGKGRTWQGKAITAMFLSRKSSTNGKFSIFFYGKIHPIHGVRYGFPSKTALRPQSFCHV